MYRHSIDGGRRQVVRDMTSYKVRIRLGLAWLGYASCRLIRWLIGPSHADRTTVGRVSRPTAAADADSDPLAEQKTK